MAGGGRGRGGRAVGRIDIGVCYTRGVRSRRLCGWWGNYMVFDLMASLS